jgi:PKD repeat protein
VAEAPEVEADFTLTANKVPAGERVTFHALNPQLGYSYKWSMPGASSEEATSPSVATTFLAKGIYSVTLTVTTPDGQEKSHTEQIEVLEVAPKAAFSVAPAVIVKGQETELIDESLYTPTRWQWHVGSDKNNYIAYDQYRTLVVDQPGVYNVTLNVANNEGYSEVTRERALIVTNADSRNGLLFSYDNANVAVAVSPIAKEQKAFTIDWWMNSAWLNTFCNGIGESDQTMQIKMNANGQMTLYVGGNSLSSGSSFVIPGEWHHYAVTFDGGNVAFYRDGVLNTSSLSVRKQFLK